MLAQINQREVSRVDTPSIQPGLSPAHKVRPLVESNDQIATDPFLLLMEDWFPIGVFDRHPHRGIETVTYIIEGAVDHYDNHGNSGQIAAGEALWLTAGRGLVHNEVPANDKPAHLLQLWVNLPAKSKMAPARFQEIHASTLPVRREDGVEVRVFSGSSGSAVSPTSNHAPVTMVEILLQPSATFRQELPAGYNGFVVVLEGDGKIGASQTPVAAGQVAWLTRCAEESNVSFAGGDRPMRAILFAGLPIGEPIVARGPFVMNTVDEIDAAYAEYRRVGQGFGAL
ncbi:pirin family protein [Sphingobium yanoikuyae]|uniref:Pirin family protein n=1 Tax=Sphingobium yanoikuyae TaxID=13690 RepID=A0A9X7U5B9_SPHYA|nr:pirin-like C-terminal cupin domain-containing protein [Sphingobium yanoikuyae]QNG43971.1 pirin family protein [Sphingobium yanoikuyae]